MYRMDDVLKVHSAATLTPAEKKFVIDYSWRQGGGFYRGLIETIMLADSGNQRKLAMGFPDEVATVLRWQAGDLAERVRALGVEV